MMTNPFVLIFSPSDYFGSGCNLFPGGGCG